MGIKRTVMGIGYMGAGSYRSRVGGVIPKEYMVWRDMIHRCYNPRLRDKYPTYTDCVVHDNWHNFQKFAEWYHSQKYCDKGYHLDKDLIVQGNKVYSAERCCFLPPALNALISINHSNRSSLVGTTFHKGIGKWQSLINKNGKSVYLGVFDTEVEAHLCYAQEKEKFVREEAVVWRRFIDTVAYDALVNWKVSLIGGDDHE